MSQKRRRDTPEWAWEQALIDAYYDYRWHQVLDPLAAAVRRWEAGELDHVDLARVAGRIRKGMSPIDYLFNEKREMLVRMIEFDEEWSGPWIAAHPRLETPVVAAYPVTLPSEEEIEHGLGTLSRDAEAGEGEDAP
jgi:hypothetical protein